MIDAARANGFVSVNVDLIYGLPRQTVAGFSATLDKVIAASPDRIALYSYAHVPHLFKPQRRIDVDDAAGARDEARDPRARDREARRGGLPLHRDGPLREAGRRAGRRAGEGKLHRNFQGYSTQPDCDMLAFGISAIGKVGAPYVAERQDARRVLREARRRRAAGDARRGARRRRPDPARRDPEAHVQLRAGLRRARRAVRHRVRGLFRAGSGVACAAGGRRAGRAHGPTTSR